MKRIDDRQLDLLITQSLQKEHDIKNINAQVLVAVKRYNRVRRWKTVVRTIAFAFGVPTMLAVMGYCAYIISITAESAMSYMLVATTIISALFMAIYSVVNFSLDEM
ncbi:MAG: hypothetical protein IIX42_02835 [Alistipes sp.]|jgi:cytochrome c biogenesis protein CcdA|nr:hypothetical protein [Alistipes sp.]